MNANGSHRLLFTTLPTNDLGLLTRSVPIALALRKRGHEVLFSSPGRAPSKLLSDAGFTNLRPRHPIYEISSKALNPKGFLKLLGSKKLMERYGGRWRFLAKLLRAIPLRFAPTVPEIWSMDHMAAMTGLKNSNFIRANCDAYMKLVEDAAPDAIVDFWNPFACIAARKLGIPLVTVNQADAHPESRGFIWWKEPSAAPPTTVPAMNKVRRKLGLGEIRKLEDLSIGDLTLIVGSPETDTLPESADVTYVGPILWQKEGEQAPDWFDRLPGDKPVVWLYPGNPRYSAGGSIWDSEVIIEACIEALRDQNLVVVLSMGYQLIPDKYLPLPNNFIHIEYVPGLIMAQRCDLMIHHGGYGSCQTGLFTGTPAVIIPTFSERESNARRVAEAGAGELLLPTFSRHGRKSLGPTALRQLVLRVLHDDSYAENAKRCSEYLKKAGDIESTASLIENYLIHPSK